MNINSENQDTFQPIKKYKRPILESMVKAYRWLKNCSEAETITYWFCKDFNTKWFKTFTLSKHASNNAHIYQENSILEAGNNRRYMKAVANNEIEKADVEILRLMKGAYFITRNVNIAFLYFINVLFWM